MLHHDRAAYKKEIRGDDEMIYVIVGVLITGFIVLWSGLIFVAVLIANEFQDE